MVVEVTAGVFWVGVYGRLLGRDISIEGQSQAPNIDLRLLVGLAGMC